MHFLLPNVSLHYTSQDGVSGSTLTLFSSYFLEFINISIGISYVYIYILVVVV